MTDEDFGWILNLGADLRLEVAGVMRNLRAGSVFPILRQGKSELFLSGGQHGAEFIVCLLTGELSLAYFRYLTTQMGSLASLNCKSDAVRLAIDFATRAESFNTLDPIDQSVATYRWLGEIHREIEREHLHFLAFLDSTPKELIKSSKIASSLKQLSRKLKLGEKHLKRRLEANWRVPAKQGLSLVKLYHAAWHLASSDRSISSIRASSGYASPSSFPIAFKNEFGCTPKELRKGIAPLEVTDRLDARLRQLRTHAPPAVPKDSGNYKREPSQFPINISGHLIDHFRQSGRKSGHIGADLFARGCKWYVFLEGTRYFETAEQMIEIPPGTIIAFKNAVRGRWKVHAAEREKFVVLFSFNKIANQIHEAATKVYGSHTTLSLDHPFLRLSETYIAQRRRLDYDSGDPEQIMQISRLGYQWLCSWLKTIQEVQNPGPERLDLTGKLVKVTEAQRLRSIESVQQYANELGYSSSHASRILKTMTKATPRNFLRFLRISTACEYLLDSDKPIHEIANLCGYSSATSFGHAFKKVISTSPGKYRAINRDP